MNYAKTRKRAKRLKLVISMHIAKRTELTESVAIVGIGKPLRA